MERMSQFIELQNDKTYRISFTVAVPSADVFMRIVGANSAEVFSSETLNTSTIITSDFNTNGQPRQQYELYFLPHDGTTGANAITVDNVSLKELVSAAVVSNVPVKEFLVGNTDEGQSIFFRADTQALQMQTSPEMYSNPIAVATEMERGTQTKVFISLDDQPFYQLEGTVTKGVSVVKPNAESDEKIKPPLAQSIQVSLRDSSAQLNRVIQLAVLTTPTPIDFSQ